MFYFKSYYNLRLQLLLLARLQYFLSCDHNFYCYFTIIHSNHKLQYYQWQCTTNDSTWELRHDEWLQSDRKLIVNICSVRLLFLVLSTYTTTFYLTLLQIPFSACKGGFLPSYRSSFLLWKKCLEVISSSLSGQKYHKED